MTEYIKREAAIEAAKHAWAKGIDPVQYMDIIPAADVVEVVRCKDCLYSTERYGHMECIHGVSYRNTWNKPDFSAPTEKGKKVLTMTVYIKREDAIDTVLDVYYNTPRH